MQLTLWGVLSGNTGSLETLGHWKHTGSFASFFRLTQSCYFTAVIVSAIAPVLNLMSLMAVVALMEPRKQLKVTSM